MGHSATIHVITRAIDKASKPLRRDFGELERLQVSKKGTADFVTNADIRTDEILTEELSHARKGWGFLNEESGATNAQDCEYRFVIDPIDGTTNFIHAIPYFCISVAVQKKLANGQFETQVGVIYDPIHDETFVAEKGEGATVNHRKLQVSARDDHKLLATSAPKMAHTYLTAMQAAIASVSAAGATIRCAGAAALDLAYVAAGRYDGLWYHFLKPWDMAAGCLMIEEAGGRVDRLTLPEHGELESSVIASNGKIHGWLKQHIEKQNQTTSS